MAGPGSVCSFKLQRVLCRLTRDGLFLEQPPIRRHRRIRVEQSRIIKVPIKPLRILLADTDVGQVGAHSGNSQEDLIILHVVASNRSTFTPFTIDIAALALVANKLGMTGNTTVSGVYSIPLLGCARYIWRSYLFRVRIDICLQCGE